ncbi:putative bifunctional diguanylate cyclase/phosphodiesterase [Paenibacillus aurantiacus]|uniref:Bifunctional diguanylate cyclase/phosphodiesterase n=1 Tax=Paenibacillus aurantiacus TaxID=1936118 RepID=A0ABV5KV83_9BACL
MSLKTKIALLITLSMSVLLALHGMLSFLSVKDMLINNLNNQFGLLSRQMAISAEYAQNGFEVTQESLDDKMKFASIAVQDKLPKRIADVTNEQLTALVKEMGFTSITLFGKAHGGIEAIRASDPNNIGIKAKDREIWDDALQELLSRQQVTDADGRAHLHYWASAFTNKTTVVQTNERWGFYNDGSTDYIINLFIQENSFVKLKRQMSPEAIFERQMKSVKGLMEFAIFNPLTIRQLVNVEELDNAMFQPLDKHPIRYGTYMYRTGHDFGNVTKAWEADEPVTEITKALGRHILKSYIPLQTSPPYVLSIVYDYDIVDRELNARMLADMKRFGVLLLLLFAVSYVLAGFLLNPIKRLLRGVEEIAKGNFGQTIYVRRRDELGQLTERFNLLSTSLMNTMSELNQKNEDALHVAFHDSLTGLYNRLAFQHDLARRFKEEGASPFYLAFIDVDRFKNANDLYGHAMGDALLQEIASRITASLPANAIAYRMGGDEFIVCLARTDEPEMLAYAKNLLARLARPFNWEGNSFKTTVSIGISSYPDDGLSEDVLVSSADVAMFKAKQQGGNAYTLFNRKMQEELQRRVVIETGLRVALEQKQFSLVYQPLVDLQSGRIVSNEALIRWTHPELGFISPVEFIAIAEETGMIGDIGLWTLQEACRQTKKWQRKGRKQLGVAVNLSGKQFLEPDLLANVQGVLQSTRLDPSCLTLEITENVAIYNEDIVIQTLKELKALGIRIALDDFGTGYSSLSYLAKFPMDVLKIDKSFVQNENEDEKEIVKTIIAMAHSLKLRVTAEGVETQEQLTYLKQEACDVLQGYLLSKPRTAADWSEAFILNYDPLRPDFGIIVQPDEQG